MKGLLDVDEINKNIWDSAVEEAEVINSDYLDSGQGISGSDENAFISRFLNSAGIRVVVKDNTYVREGFNLPVERTQFEEEVFEYNNGGSVKKEDEFISFLNYKKTR